MKQRRSPSAKPLGVEELVAFCKRVEKLRAEGLDHRIIAERLGVGRATIHDRMRRYRGILSESCPDGSSESEFPAAERPPVR